MYVFRPARFEDLHTIYDMQNVPFRDVVYANYLPRYPLFEQATLYTIKNGREDFYIFEADGRPDGFVEYVKYAKEWNIIVWGKWLNTLIYLGLKTAYDDLGCPNVTSAIRQNNKRVCKAYEKFRIRRTGQEMVLYQQGSHLGNIATANLIYYEMTRDEFEERREWLRKNSLEVTIMPPQPFNFPEPTPAPETSAALEPEKNPGQEQIPETPAAPEPLSRFDAMKPVVRRACESDLQAIYDLQNGPFRNEVLDSPPVPFEEYRSQVLSGISSAREHYFVFDEGGAVTHFIWFQFSQDLWFTLIWGRWLRSLVYADFAIAFRSLHFPRLYFWIRQKNRRMMKIAEDPGYGFVKIGEDAGYVLRDEYPHLVVVRSNCYEIRSDVYFEREEYYRKQSMDLAFDL